MVVPFPEYRFTALSGDHFFYPTKRIRPGCAEIRRKQEQREKE